MNEDTGQPWAPPPELMRPTPRPVRKVEGIDARSWVVLLSIAAVGVAIAFWYARQFGIWGKSIVAACLLGMGLLVWLAIYLTARKMQRLLTWGKPARAVVTHVWTSKSRNGRTMGYGADIEFQDDAGNLVKVTEALAEEELKRFGYDLDEYPAEVRYAEDRAPTVITLGLSKSNQVLAVLTVLYDPDKPSEYVVYPVDEYEIGEPEDS